MNNLEKFKSITNFNQSSVQLRYPPEQFIPQRNDNIQPAWSINCYKGNLIPSFNFLGCSFQAYNYWTPIRIHLLYYLWWKSKHKCSTKKKKKKDHEKKNSLPLAVTYIRGKRKIMNNNNSPLNVTYMSCSWSFERAVLAMHKNAASTL